VSTPAGEGRLADGGVPSTPEDLFERLRELGIETQTVRHPPVYTVEEAKALRGDLPGAHTKSLFLRDKKKTMWLVVCLEDRRIDLKVLASMLESGRLSFGSADRLMRYLGVIPGAVSPFAVINDRGRAVRVALDTAVLENAPLNLHPLDNAMTTSIAPRDLLAFLDAEGHQAQLLEFA